MHRIVQSAIDCRRDLIKYAIVPISRYHYLNPAVCSSSHCIRMNKGLH
jgi:hypothetical protein